MLQVRQGSASERNLLKKHDHGSFPHPAKGPGLRVSTLQSHDGLTKAAFFRENARKRSWVITQLRTRILHKKGRTFTAKRAKDVKNDGIDFDSRSTSLPSRPFALAVSRFCFRLVPVTSGTAGPINASLMNLLPMAETVESTDLCSVPVGYYQGTGDIPPRCPV